MPPTPTRHAAGTQRGAATITLLLLMLSLVAMLGLVEVGYLYWVKRDLQKVADLAALAGAGRLEQCNASNDDNLAARASALSDNAHLGTLTIRCGYWHPGNAGEDHFLDASAEHPVNAVKVVARRSPLPFFNQIDALPTISASAVAWHSAPQVAFSVGSQLLNVNGQAPLQQVLKLLGVDIDGVTVAGYQGLADLQITPRGLLEALGLGVGTDLTVGDYNALLQGNRVGLGQLLEATTALASQQGLLGLDLSLLQQRLAAANLDSVRIALGSTDTTSGLFAHVVGASTDPATGLDVQLNALDLISTAASIAGAGHAATISGLQVLGTGVSVQASVVEPPSIGVGPVGTTAYNAQVRLFIDIDSNDITLLSAAFKLLGTRLLLPIYIDVIDGYATATAIDCAGSPRNASFAVTSSVANVCVGKTSVDWRSTRDLCGSTLQDEQLLTLFGLPLLSSRIRLPALSDTQNLTINEGDTGSTSPHRLPIGDTLADLSSALLGLLGDLLSPGSSDNSTASAIAGQYLEATRNASTGRYSATAVIEALKNGTGDLGALGTWQTQIPSCNLLYCTPTTGDVWQGFLASTQINGSLLGSVLDLLGLTACDGLLTQLLAYNSCIRNNLARYLKTKPGGLDGLGSYNPSTGSGSCNGVVCLLLRPVVDAILRPLLNAIGSLLSQVLANVLGLELGRSDIHVQSIQCHSAQLVH